MAVGGSIGNVHFRCDPDSVSWDFAVKSSVKNTIGGQVIQVFGVKLGEMTVSGSFGKGGFAEQAKFVDSIMALARQQAIGFMKPHRFLLPSRRWDFVVYVKGLTTPDGMSGSVHISPEIVNPRWQLRLFLVEDNAGLKKLAADTYIARLTAGIGWKPGPYNGPMTAEEANTAAALAATKHGPPPEAGGGGTAATTVATGGTVAAAGGPAADGTLSIMGPATVTGADLGAWFVNNKRKSSTISRLNNMPVNQLAQMYVDTGTKEGVRGDFTFVQACNETGWFTNNDTSIFNFAGIGHYDNAKSGFSFAGVQTGVTAHIQLMKKVVNGNGVALASADVAPKWGGRQTATVGGLAKNWASAPNYATALMAMWNDMLASCSKKTVA